MAVAPTNGEDRAVFSIGELSVVRIREKSVIDFKGFFQEEWHLRPAVATECEISILLCRVK
jgi:hypothetical protein